MMKHARSDRFGYRTAGLAALAACLASGGGRSATAEDPTASLSPVVERRADAEVVLLEHCLVTPIDDVRVPALRSGVLTAVKVREGEHVAAGEPIAQFDDREALRKLQAAIAERDAAKLRTDSKLKEEEALAVRDVAAAEHEAAIKANEKFADSVSQFEIRRLELTQRRADISQKVIAYDRRVAMVELGAAEAGAAAAAEDVERRLLKAPFEGDVTEIHLHAGEWAEEGKPIVRIVRMNRLRVEGFIKVRDILPADVVGRQVRVEAELTQGSSHAFTGEITFVSPVIQAGGEYRVWAEVANRQERGHWLLRPGLEARMSIRR
jgi:multidrug efflux pump subunit AcrA (membrane-fusion protein)